MNLFKYYKNNRLRRLVRYITNDDSINKALEINETIPFADSSRSIVARCIWFLLMLANSSLCVYQVSVLSRNYFSWKLGVQIINSDNEYIPMPNIFMCDFDSEQTRQFRIKYDIDGMGACLNPMRMFLSKKPLGNLSEFYEKYDPKNVVEEIKLTKKSVEFDEATSKSQVHSCTETICRQFLIDDQVQLNDNSLKLIIKMNSFNTSSHGCNDQGSRNIGFVAKGRTIFPLYSLSFIRQNIWTELLFTASKYENENSPNKPCVTAEEHTDCEKKCYYEEILKIMENSSCIVPFHQINHLPNINKPRCATSDSAIEFQDKISGVFDHPKCSCTRICDDLQYSIFSSVDEHVASEHVVIKPQSEYIRIAKEYYLITFISLICDIGGNVGLFLGLSALSMIESLIGLFKIAIRKYFCSKQNLYKQNRLHRLITRIYIIERKKIPLSYPAVWLDYIFDYQKKKKCIIWAVICATAIMICSTNTYVNVSYYLSQPTYITLEVVKDSHVHLPDAVVCIESQKFQVKKQTLLKGLKNVPTVKECQHLDFYDVIDNPRYTAEKLWNLMSLEKDFNDQQISQIVKNLVGKDMPFSDRQFNYSTIYGQCTILTKAYRKYNGLETSHFIISSQDQKHNGCPYCEYRIFLIPYGEYFDLKKQEVVLCGVETQLKIQRQTVIKLNLKKRSCASFEEGIECEENCKQKFFNQNINCSLPFIKNSKLTPCNTSIEAKQTRAAYIRAYVSIDLIKECNCLPKCNNTIYYVTTQPGIDESGASGTIIKIRLNSEFREISTEILAFTLINLFCNFGSTLSSMLGVSLLTVMQIADVVIKKRNF